MPKFTHNSLQSDLAAHLRGSTERMVWENTQLGPSGSPRPDVFTVNKSYAKFRTDCYEIKVSLSDLRSDLTSGKWQSYRKFGNCVWFAFERGLAPMDLIPIECGIILRGESGWRAARKPVAQVLDTLPRDAWLKLLIESHPEEWERQQKIHIRRVDSWTEQAILRKKGGDRIAELLSNVQQGEVSLSVRRASIDAELAGVDAQIKRIRERADQERSRHQERLSIELTILGEVLGLRPEQCTVPQLTTAIGHLSCALRGSNLQRTIGEMQKLEALLQGQRIKELNPC